MLSGLRLVDAETRAGNETTKCCLDTLPTIPYGAVTVFQKGVQPQFRLGGLRHPE
jgi:hypothetical protein